MSSVERQAVPVHQDALMTFSEVQSPETPTETRTIRLIQLLKTEQSSQLTQKFCTSERASAPRNPAAQTPPAGASLGRKQTHLQLQQLLPVSILQLNNSEWMDVVVGDRDLHV